MTEEELVVFEEQSRCGYSAAELLVLAAGNDCEAARKTYGRFVDAELAAHPELEMFIGEVGSGLEAIAHRLGQKRKLATPCGLLAAIEKSEAL